MSILKYYKNFNNYFNRRVIKSDTLPIGFDVNVENDVNWNPNDDITTEKIVNWNQTWKPDYVFEVDSNDNILSRWFITGWKRTRAKQYKAEYKRDLIADNYDALMNTNFVINKGWIKDPTSPLLYNPEGFSFNQIKKNEWLLKDNHNSMPFLVMYWAKEFTSPSPASVNIDLNEQSPDITINTTLENSIYNTGTYNSLDYNVNIDFRFQVYANEWTGERYYQTGDINGAYNQIVQRQDSAFGPILTERHFPSGAESIISGPLNRIFSRAHSISIMNKNNQSYTGRVSNNDKQLLDDLINKGSQIVKTSNNQYYRVSATKQTMEHTENLRKESEPYLVAKTYLLNEYSDYNDSDYPSIVSIMTLKTLYDRYSVTAVPIENVTMTVTPTFTNKQTTNDNECNIMLFPYADGQVTSGSETFNIRKELQFDIVRAIAQKYTNSIVFDVQLLPYVPTSISSHIYSNLIQINSMDAAQYEVFRKDNVGKAICFYTSTSNFSLDIPFSIPMSDYSINNKVDNETKFYRICSPNYSNSFDFSPWKNQGVEFINIDVAYKAYNPYIHLNPNFKSTGLYGADYNSPTGLVCMGDFSLPIFVDKWSEYEINNKNYQNIFKRQLESLDFNNNLNMVETMVNATTGVIQGAAGGALAGSYSGMGAMGGGLVGGALSTIGGAADIGLTAMRMGENRDLTIDLWKYNLGNVKALPVGLSKVNPFTPNNKVFPVIELYGASDEEYWSYQSYIYVNGMSLNVVGLLKDYIDTNQRTFFKGSLIWLEDIAISPEEIDEINKEIMRGVYF